MILVGDEVTFRNNDIVYKVRAVTPDVITVEVYGESFVLSWDQADELGIKIKQASKKKKYTVKMSVMVSVELNSEDGPRAVKDAADIVLGGLNSVEGMHAEENLPPVVVDDD